MELILKRLSLSDILETELSRLKDEEVKRVAAQGPASQPHCGLSHHSSPVSQTVSSNSHSHCGLSQHSSPVNQTVSPTSRPLNQHCSPVSQTVNTTFQSILSGEKPSVSVVSESTDPTVKCKDMNRKNEDKYSKENTDLLLQNHVPNMGFKTGFTTSSVRDADDTAIHLSQTQNGGSNTPRLSGIQTDNVSVLSPPDLEISCIKEREVHNTGPLCSTPIQKASKSRGSSQGASKLANKLANRLRSDSEREVCNKATDWLDDFEDTVEDNGNTIANSQNCKKMLSQFRFKKTSQIKSTQCVGEPGNVKSGQYRNRTSDKSNLNGADIKKKPEAKCDSDINNGRKMRDSLNVDSEMNNEKEKQNEQKSVENEECIKASGSNKKRKFSVSQIEGFDSLCEDPLWSPPVKYQKYDLNQKDPLLNSEEKPQNRRTALSSESPVQRVTDEKQKMFLSPSPTSNHVTPTSNHVTPTSTQSSGKLSNKTLTKLSSFMYVESPKPKDKGIKNTGNEREFISLNERKEGSKSTAIDGQTLCNKFTEKDSVEDKSKTRGQCEAQYKGKNIGFSLREKTKKSVSLTESNVNTNENVPKPVQGSTVSTSPFVNSPLFSINTELDDLDLDL